MTDLKKVWELGFSVGDISSPRNWNSKAHEAHQYQTNDGARKYIDEAPAPALLVLIDHEKGFDAGYTHAIEMIRSGTWVALGYEHPRTLASPLVVIPSHVVSGMGLIMKNSVMTGNGLCFVGVRFVHKSLMERLDVTVTRSAGRPSKQQQIAEAIRELVDQGRFDPLLKNQHGQFELVRSKVNELYPTDDPSNKGMGDQVIYKILREQFS